MLCKGRTGGMQKERMQQLGADSFQIGLVFSWTFLLTPVQIVATDLPTHTQILDASDAVLCAATAEGMAKGMLDVLADPARFAPLGAAARARVTSNYSREAFRRKLLAAYASIAPVRSRMASII